MMIHNMFGVYKLQFDRRENQIALVTLRKRCSCVTGTGWECDRKFILNNFKLITMNYLIM
jgi:hypothetical protein